MNITILSGLEVVKNEDTTFCKYGTNKNNERVVWCGDWVLGLYFPDDNIIIVMKQKTIFKTFLIVLHELAHWVIFKLGDCKLLHKKWDLQKII